MSQHTNYNIITPHENDILEGLVQDGYFKAIDEAKLSKKKFLEKLIEIQEEERKKLGHELHDSVNSSLAIAKFYLSLLPAATQDQKFAKDQLSTIIATTVESIRSISCNLVMFQEVESGLIQLVENLIKRIKGLELFEINFYHSSKKLLDELPNCQKIVLYRILQEQLNNTIKYSRACNVNITLVRCNDDILLLISDNGIGFDPLTHSNGIGLSNISNRVKQFNGQVSIKSSPGKGCLLKVQMPVLV
jgi:signal transduction histidine kinase